MATLSSVTVFRRPLPPTCVSLSSPRGQELFQSALIGGGAGGFFSLISHFHTQAEPAFCGLASLVTVLNAFNVDPHRRMQKKAPWRYYSEELLDCCVMLDVIEREGITLDEFTCVARCNGALIETFYSDPSVGVDTETVVESETGQGCAGGCCGSGNGPCCASKEAGDGGNTSSCHPAAAGPEVNLELFRTLVEEACRHETKRHVVVSYSRKCLNQTGDGHFSPIGAYDRESDMALVLDTARFKYEPHWVPVSLLFEASKMMDNTTKRSRGFSMLAVDERPQAQMFRLILNKEAWGTLPDALHSAVSAGVNALHQRAHADESLSLSPDESCQLFVGAVVDRLLKHEVIHAFSKVGVASIACGKESSECGRAETMGDLNHTIQRLRPTRLHGLVDEHTKKGSDLGSGFDPDVLTVVIHASAFIFEEELTRADTGDRTVLGSISDLFACDCDDLKVEIDGLSRTLQTLSEFC